MNPYYCVYYRISDTYRKNFPTAAEAIEFATSVGGVAFSCNSYGSRVSEIYRTPGISESWIPGVGSVPEEIW